MIPRVFSFDPNPDNIVEKNSSKTKKSEDLFESTRTHDDKTHS